jgi:hypothetical protein
MGIDFGALIRRSFEIAWRYKSLWIFGLFVGGGGYYNLNLRENLAREYGGGDSLNMYDFSGLENFIREHLWEVISAVAVWLAAVVVISLVCYLISSPAMIDAVNKITRGGSYRFTDSFSRGLDFFWRFAGLFLFGLGLMLFLVFGIVLLAIFLTPFTLILTIPVGFVVSVLAWHILALGGVAMVARDTDIGNAIEEGWTLVKQNMSNIVLITLLYIALAIGFWVVLGIIAAIAFWPIGALVALLTGSLWPAILLALVIGLPISLVLGGYQGTFFNALYVQFYFRLVEPTPVPSAIPTGPSNPPGPPPTGPAV